MTDWDRVGARYRSIVKCEHGTTVEENGVAYPCYDCTPPHAIRVISADRRGTHVRAVCTGCPWRGRPRNARHRAERDGDHHVEEKEA